MSITKTGIQVDTDPRFSNPTEFEENGQQRQITAIGLESETTYHVRGYIISDGNRIYSDNTKQFTTGHVDYLMIKNTSNSISTIGITKIGSPVVTIEYSLDGGAWTSWSSTGSDLSISVPAGKSVRFRGNNATLNAFQNGIVFTSSAACDLRGDVNTLLNKVGGDITLPQYAFWHLFAVMPITDASYIVLPSTTLSQGCYMGLFHQCNSLTNAPILPATTLAQSCYDTMFFGCTSLTRAPALPATTLATACYKQMFDYCYALVNAPILPATTLADSCYDSMFENCTSLTQAPALPATSLIALCYNSMFAGCTSLTQAPALPATSLTTYCYSGMFYGCTSLTQAPALPATSLVTGCYLNMFNGCSSLNRIITYATTWNTTNANNWVSGVAASGIFYNLGQAGNIPIDDTSGVPIGWTPKTSIDFVKIENTYNGANSISLRGFGSYNLSITVKYSTDLVNWTEHDFRNGNSGVSVTLQAGESVYFCGNNSTFNNRSSYVMFSSDYSCEVSGDINTLLNEFGGDMSLPTWGACFFRLFQGMNHMENAGIILPSTTLSTNCYEQMFHNCSSMTTAPNLPATTLADSCYFDMFDGCTSLTTAPTLPATTLASHCYYLMFRDCTSLNRVITYASDIRATDCISNWLYGVAATGDFYNLGGATYQSGASGIPSGWTEHTSI